MGKKGNVIRKLLSNPRARRAFIKLLTNPTVRRGALRLAKNSRVRRAVGTQLVRGRLRRRKTRRQAGRPYYSGAVGLGIGALVIVILISLFTWLLRRVPRASSTVPRVRDLMTSEVVTVEPQTSIVDAARRMIQQEKGPLPVVEGDRPVAMITDRDIIARVVAEGRDPTSATVAEIATRELVTIGPDQDVTEAARLMAEHQLDRILVVEGDRLVGIISEADIRADEGPLA